ncbi:MAG: UDP-N-acetylenolpyruvoylglucosamine reductase [Acidimicrobiaceae bacterium]|nr:UDP-N-acetylenolpyruvoylglucosamine reductase [Acidimicrobiaceae bacterium]
MNPIATLLERGGARVEERAPLGARTTYRVGGTAQLLVTLSSRDDLEALSGLMLATGLVWVVVGNGSNLLVQDGERAVLAIHLSGDFSQLSWRLDGDDALVEAGAGLDVPVGARRVAAAGMVGFEWAVGVPGSVGGAVAMNAGGHGSDMAAVLDQVTVWRDGVVETWSRDRLALGYRTSAVRRSDLVLGATLRLRRGEADQAQERVREIVRWRREHQPGGANGGSVFTNPPGDHAARLIEAAGCKGLRHASAQVSEKHANFIQADPQGSADDVYELMNIVRERVATTSGVTLVSEHRFVGFGVTP